MTDSEYFPVNEERFDHLYDKLLKQMRKHKTQSSSTEIHEIDRENPDDQGAYLMRVRFKNTEVQEPFMRSDFLTDLETMPARIAPKPDGFLLVWHYG